MNWGISLMRPVTEQDTLLKIFMSAEYVLFWKKKKHAVAQLAFLGGPRAHTGRTTLNKNKRIPNNTTIHRNLLYTFFFNIYFPPPLNMPPGMAVLLAFHPLKVTFI